MSNQFAKDAFVSIGADTRDLKRGLDKAKQEASQFARDTLAIGAKLTGLSAAGFAGVGIAAKQFADLDAELRAVQGIAGATDEEMAALTDTVRQLGASTSFTSLEVADAAKNLARAGLSTEEVAAALRDTLNLARSAGVEIADASAIASRALRQFAIDAADTARVVDVLAKASNSGAFDLIDLGETLKFIGPIARGVGQSIEEVAAVAATLANQGLRGGLPGRQYKRLLIELADVEKQAKLAALGVNNIFDGLGRLQSPVVLFEQINAALDKLTDQERLSVLDDIFGEAAPAAQALSDNVAGLTELTEKLKNESRGYARANADLIDEGLLGQFKILISAVTDLGIELGRIFGKQLELGIKVAVEFVNAIKDWVAQNEELIRTIIPIIAAVGLFGTVAGALGIVATNIAGSIALVTLALSATGLTLTAVISPFAAVAGAVAGLTAAYLGLIKVVQFFMGRSNESALGSAFALAQRFIESATESLYFFMDAIVRVASLWRLNLSEITLEAFQKGAAAGSPVERADRDLVRLTQLLEILRENDGKFLDPKQLEEFKALLVAFEKQKEVGLGLTFEKDGSVTGLLDEAAGFINDTQASGAKASRVESLQQERELLRRQSNAARNALRRNRTVENADKLSALLERMIVVQNELRDALRQPATPAPTAPEGRGVSGTPEEQAEAKRRAEQDALNARSKKPEDLIEDPFAETFAKVDAAIAKQQIEAEEKALREREREASRQARGIVGRLDDFGIDPSGQFGTQGLGQRIFQQTLSVQELLVDEAKTSNQLLKAIEKAILNGTLVVG